MEYSAYIQFSPWTSITRRSAIQYPPPAHLLRQSTEAEAQDHEILDLLWADRDSYLDWDLLSSRAQGSGGGYRHARHALCQ